MVLAASLAHRLALLASPWVIGALLAAWFATTGLVARHLEHGLDARMTALADAIVATVTIDGDGTPALQRPLAESRFDLPLSGLYWQIETAGGRIATSRSLWDQRLPRGTSGHGAVRVFETPGPRGQALRVLERDIELPEAGAPLHVLVATARDEMDAEMTRLSGVLALAFVLLGLGLVAAVVVQVRLGLAPLNRLRAALAELRAGGRASLDLPAPGEVKPLIEEIDALVVQNRATIERARSHVGNLAHALKTPLAILHNALDRPEGADLADLVSEHYEAMLSHHGRAVGLKAARKHLDWYLEAAVTAPGRAVSKGRASSHPLRARLLGSTDPKEVLGAIRTIFTSDLERRAA